MLADLGRGLVVLVLLLMLAVIAGAVMSRAELQRYLNMRKM